MILCLYSKLFKCFDFNFFILYPFSPENIFFFTNLSQVAQGPKKLALKNGKQCKSKQKYEYITLHNTLFLPIPGSLVVLPYIFPFTRSLSIFCEKLRLQASMVLNRGVNAREIFSHTHTYKKIYAKTEPQNRTRWEWNGMDESRKKAHHHYGQTITTPTSMCEKIQWLFAICGLRILI